MTNEKSNADRQFATSRLTQSAILIAMAIVLSYFKLAQWTFGGSVTLGSMIPIMLISMKYPFSWSLTSAVAYSLIQMMQGFYAPPVENLLYYTLMILLDYVVAFGGLSLAGPVYRALKKKISERNSIMAATTLCLVLRFLCHFASGIIVWAAYAPANQPVWLYSLIYNGSYMLAECVISGAIMGFAGPRLVNLP